MLSVSSHSPSFKLGAVTIFVDLTSIYYTNSAYSQFSATTDWISYPSPFVFPKGKTLLTKRGLNAKTLFLAYNN